MFLLEQGQLDETAVSLAHIFGPDKASSREEGRPRAGVGKGKFESSLLGSISRPVFVSIYNTGIGRSN